MGLFGRKSFSKSPGKPDSEPTPNKAADAEPNQEPQEPTPPQEKDPAPEPAAEPAEDVDKTHRAAEKIQAAERGKRGRQTSAEVRASNTASAATDSGAPDAPNPGSEPKASETPAASAPPRPAVAVAAFSDSEAWQFEPYTHVVSLLSGLCLEADGEPGDAKRKVKLAAKEAGNPRQMWRFTKHGQLACAEGAVLTVTGSSAAAKVAVGVANPASLPGGKTDSGQKWALTEAGYLECEAGSSFNKKMELVTLLLTVKNGVMTAKAELWLNTKQKGSKAQLWALDKDDLAVIAQRAGAATKLQGLRRGANAKKEVQARRGAAAETAAAAERARQAAAEEEELARLALFAPVVSELSGLVLELVDSDDDATASGQAAGLEGEAGGRWGPCGQADGKRAVRLAARLPSVGSRGGKLRGAAYEKQLWRPTVEGRLECAFRGFVLEVAAASTSGRKAPSAAKVAAKDGLCAGWADRKVVGQKWRLSDRGELRAEVERGDKEALMVTVKNGDKTDKAELWLNSRKSTKAQLWAHAAPSPKRVPVPPPLASKASFAAKSTADKAKPKAAAKEDAAKEEAKEEAKEVKKEARRPSAGMAAPTVRAKTPVKAVDKGAETSEGAQAKADTKRPKLKSHPSAATAPSADKRRPSASSTDGVAGGGTGGGGDAKELARFKAATAGGAGNVSTNGAEAAAADSAAAAVAAAASGPPPAKRNLTGDGSGDGSGDGASERSSTAARARSVPRNYRPKGAAGGPSVRGGGNNPLHRPSRSPSPLRPGGRRMPEPVGIDEDANPWVNCPGRHGLRLFKTP